MLRFTLVALVMLAVGCSGCAHKAPTISAYESSMSQRYIDEVAHTVFVDVDYHTKGTFTTRKGATKVDKESGWTGSGVVIKSDPSGSLILTAGHVAAEPPMIEISEEGILQQEVSNFRIAVMAADGTRCAATMVSIYKDHDLALLKASCVIGKPAKLAATLPKQGERIEAVGCPTSIHLPGAFPIMEGRLVGFFVFAGVPQLGMSIPVAGGASGSGVYNTSGELIGIVMSVTTFQHMSYAVDLDSIKRYLAQ